MLRSVSMLEGRPPLKRARAGENIQSHNKATQTFLETLSDLRRENICCDVTLVAGDDDVHIRAHRVVLAARSPWFEAIVRRWSEDGGSQDEIRIQEVIYSSIHALGGYGPFIFPVLPGEPSWARGSGQLLLYWSDHWCQRGDCCGH